MFTSRRIAVLGGDKFRDEYSLDFDGTDDYIDLGDNKAFIAAGNHSFSFWVKNDDGRESGTRFYMGSNKGDGTNEMYISHTSGGIITYYIRGNSDNDAATASTALVDGVNPWTHVVITAAMGETDGGDAKIYINGTLDASTSLSSISKSNWNAYDTGCNFWVGCQNQDNSVSGAFDGKMSDLAMYNKVLSAAEIATIYNGREPYNHKEGVASSNLAYWYRMGDGISDKGNASDTTFFIGDEASSILLGSELTTDPNFETDVANDTAGTYWTTGDGWAITGGKAVASNTTNSVLRAAILTVGQVYKVTYTVSDYTSGKVRVLCGNDNGTAVSATGTYRDYLRATTTHFSIDAYTPAFVGAISSVSVKAIGSVNGGLTDNMTKEDFVGDTP